MSSHEPRPRRQPVLLLWLAIGAAANAVLGLVAAATRADAGLLGWPYAAIWTVSAVLASWQWRRTVRAFRAAGLARPERPARPTRRAR